MIGLFNEASLVLVPSGYKSGKVYERIEYTPIEYIE
jgi:hypothetical protein